MIVVGGSDEFVVGCIQGVADASYFSCDLVNILLRCHAGLFGIFFDFLSVFVRSGQEENVIALKSFIAGNGISENDFIAVADMGLS